MHRGRMFMRKLMYEWVHWLRPARWKFDGGTKRNSLRYEICKLFYTSICNIAAVFTWPSNDLNLQPQYAQMPTLYLRLQFQSRCTVQQVTAKNVKLVSFYQMCMIWPLCDPVALLAALLLLSPANKNMQFIFSLLMQPPSLPSPSQLVYIN